MIKLTGQYVAAIRQTPEHLYDDVMDQRITKQDAIIALGQLIYGIGEDALIQRAAFKDFWVGRVGGRQSFAAASADTELTGDEVSIIEHTMKVAERLQKYPAFDGLWDELGNHTIFKVAEALGGKLPARSAQADVEEAAPEDVAEEITGRDVSIGGLSRVGDANLGNRARRHVGVDLPDLNRGIK